MLLVGRFLGILVNRHEINVEPIKIKVVQVMPSPKSLKELKSFRGKVSYLRRFIPALAEISHMFQPLLKKKSSWVEDLLNI